MESKDEAAVERQKLVPDDEIENDDEQQPSSKAKSPVLINKVWLMIEKLKAIHFNINYCLFI